MHRWNSKERVLAAIRHETADRVPIDFWAESDVKRKLCERLGLKDEESLLRHFQVDIRCIYPRYIGPVLKTYEDGSFEDFWGVIRTPVRPHGHGDRRATRCRVCGSG